MPQAHDRVRAAAGFTLIETIVALVVLSTTLIVFYDFLSTVLNGANRVQAAAIAFDRRMNALELATTLNPMDLPQGSFDLGTYRIQWDSQLVGEVHQSSRYPAGPGLFKVALYRIRLSFPDHGEIAPIAVTRVGYHPDSAPVGTSN
jgi:prepilin-type N-terminal cleavage/methylation domain-containing protein